MPAASSPAWASPPSRNRQGRATPRQKGVIGSGAGARPAWSRRLVLRDVHGRWLELDRRVLEADPLVWHLLDAGVRRSLDRGTLRHGAYVLQELADRIDGHEARAVLKASGLL
ncbi:hypothetical protein SSP35_11_00020 [Streptomyces sp. NBRC 110611]|nr:hypothetical protein SSP35_11_00020 [Streptomyces sp. NBRC 110611]